MVLPTRPDPPQQLQRVRVVHNHLILLGIHHVQKPITRVDCQTHRILQPFGDLVFHLVLRIEDHDPVHLAV